MPAVCAKCGAEASEDKWLNTCEVCGRWVCVEHRALVALHKGFHSDGLEVMQSFLVCLEDVGKLLEEE